MKTVVNEVEDNEQARLVLEEAVILSYDKPTARTYEKQNNRRLKSENSLELMHWKEAKVEHGL